MAQPDDDLLSEIIPDDQQEDESDLDSRPVSFKDAVLMTADWTVETLNGQVHKGNINLDPDFQRRAAWDNIRKSRLIESLIVGLPIPNIVLAENKESRGKFIVIDGKQRLLTVNEFMSDNLPLTGLDLRKDLIGKTFSTLEPEDREFLENNSIRSTVVKNWPDDNFLYTMFFRLNSGSLQLSPQELRKALIGGNLINAIENYIENSEEFHLIFGGTPDKRMRDSELVLRFIAFDRSYQGYNGNLKQFLDTTTKFYEANWAEQATDLQVRFARLNLAIKTANDIFLKDTFKKWLGDRYERRINRAVFDCITRFFSEQHIVNLALERKSDVVDAYKQICLVEAFRNSIEKTTKSLGATHTRMDKWGESLSKILNLPYDHPTARLG